VISTRTETAVTHLPVEQNLTPRARRIVQLVQQAWGEGRVDLLDELLTEDFVRSGRTSQMSRDELKNSILDMRRAFPDLTMTVDRAVEMGDDLSISWQSTGTLMDTYLGLPPTGRQFAVTGATFSRLRGDRIKSEWVVYDRRGGYVSLGVPLGSVTAARRASTDVAVEPEAVRSLHRKLVTGVTVVATDANGEPRGLAVNAFSSVSLEPPLILICVQKNSSTYSHLLAASHFGVSILSAAQVGVANVFATKQPDKFSQVDWHRGPHGSPLLDGACAQMEVELHDTLHASTHTIFIGQVTFADHSDAAPLVYSQGGFFDGGRLSAASVTDE
jgi:steroid delta-isomerase-like uncharacterized protein